MKKRILFSFSTVLLFFILTTNGISAEESLNQNIEYLEFQGADSEKNPFEYVILEEDEDGEAITIKGTKEANGIPERYSVQVDTKNKTYTVEKVETAPVVSPNNYTIQNPDPGTGTERSAWVRAITDDPVGVDLARTTLNAYWTSYGSLVSYRNKTLSTWVANPSTFGTHWYRSGSSMPPHYFDSGYLVYKGNASYYNYDFGDNSKITRVSHDITLRAKGSSYDYFVNWTRSGEGAYLLDLDIVAQ